MAAQIHIVRVAEADKHQTLQIPHGGKADDLLPVGGLFDHHEQPRLFNLRGQGVQRGGDECILQSAALVFLVVIDHHANDPGGVLSQQNARHTGNILPLFQSLLHPADSFIGSPCPFSVEHVGHRGGAQTQLLGDIPDCYPFFFLHRSLFLPFF